MVEYIGVFVILVYLFIIFGFLALIIYLIFNRINKKDKETFEKRDN